MGDPNKFQNVYLYHIFNILLLCLLLSELFIFIYTFQKGGKKSKEDKGSKWLLYANFILCIWISFYFVSQSVPAAIRNMSFPYFISYIGLAFIPTGIAIRIKAVLTLKKAFTLTVQTSKNQHLVTTGLYHKLRHPAYTGSIISLLGVALSFRNILAVIFVFTLCLLFYGIRIRIEENALNERFHAEFQEYKKHSFKLFPYVW